MGAPAVGVGAEYQCPAHLLLPIFLAAAALVAAQHMARLPLDGCHGLHRPRSPEIGCRDVDTFIAVAQLHSYFSPGVEVGVAGGGHDAARHHRCRGARDELIPLAGVCGPHQLVANWQQTLLENLEDPFTQDSLGLLPPASKKLIDAFLASRKLPDPMTAEFANAVQEALSGLEKIPVKGDEIKQALLQGGSPAMPEELRKRFDTFMNERCKGKDATKLRFVIE